MARGRGDNLRVSLGGEVHRFECTAKAPPDEEWEFLTRLAGALATADDAIRLAS